MLFQTTDPSKIISIHPGDDVAEVVGADSVQHGGFNLVNTCSDTTMRKVRDAAKQAGVNVIQPQKMAVI